MKTYKKQTLPESKKRSYTKPELKKREQIREVTEGTETVVTLILKGS